MIDNTFYLNELMGIGGSSKVYSAKSTDGNDYALKIIRKDKGYSEELAKKLVQNEHLIMSKLGNHPNLVGCNGYNSDGIANLADGQHAIRYLVLEKCKNGALSTIIRHTGQLEEHVAKFLFLQLWCAVQYVHDRGFAHMDIKLENILLDDLFNIKLADLGTAIDISETLGYTNKRRGTPNYMAPELQNKSSAHMVDATISDVYSLGVCMHLLLTGEFPSQLPSDNQDSSMDTESSGYIVEDSIDKWVKGRLEYVSEDAKQLLEKMLERNYCHRLTIEEILQHPWMNSSEYQGEIYEELKARLETITVIKQNQKSL
jgi:serine/threonine protein kinase